MSKQTKPFEIHSYELKTHNDNQTLRIKYLGVDKAIQETLFTLRPEIGREMALEIIKSLLAPESDLTDFINDIVVKSTTARRKRSDSIRRRNLNWDFNPAFADAKLIIASPDDIELLIGQQITNSAGEFMEAMGFELDIHNEPVKGSWWQWAKFKSKSPRTAAEIEDIYDQGKRALETRHVGNPTADETLKLADASAKLLDALKNIPIISVRLERIIILKYPNDKGESVVSIQSVSSALGKYLDENPQVLLNPQVLHNMIIAQQSLAKPKELGEGEGVQSGTV